MRSALLLPVLALSLACAGERAAAPEPAAGDRGTLLKAEDLGRVRCLVVAPFENGSDAPLASEAATAAVAAHVDSSRVRVFPIPELQALFRDTPLDLPAGIGPSLALELAEVLGADAVLYGSIEGHSRGPTPELLVTIRLSLVSEHRLLFARTVLVTPREGERTSFAIRRSVLTAVRPALTRLGDSGRKRCFEPERTRSLRKLAHATPPAAEATLAAAASTPASLSPAASAAPPQPARPAPRTPRQMEWAKRLEGGERLVLDDVAFAGRSAELQRNLGLADLAIALFALPSLTIRLEAFVDATGDLGEDRSLSAAMAQAAASELTKLGIPRDRVITSGRGGESPRLPNFTVRGRATNRRIEVEALR